MSTLVLVLSLLFGQSHVYSGQNVGVMFGCTPGDSYSSGYEIVGDPGPYRNNYEC